MNSQIVAKRVYAFGALLGIGLFFIPKVRLWIVYVISLFYSKEVNTHTLMLIVGLLTGLFLDMCYMVYLKEGRWGLIRIAGIIGILIILTLILSSGFLGTQVLYF